MPDKEKVIDDLNVAKLILCNPQMLTPEMCIRIGQAVTSAISLLKEEQEPVKPKEKEPCNENGITLWYCPNCGFYLGPSDNFCSNCGRAVRWDGD